MAGYWTPMLAGYSKPIDIIIPLGKFDADTIARQGSTVICFT
jgi:hypothetical protein